MALTQFSNLDYCITFGLLLTVLGMAVGVWWPSCGALHNALLINQISPYLLLTFAHCDDPVLRHQTLDRVVALGLEHPLSKQLLNQLVTPAERSYFLARHQKIDDSRKGN